MVRRSFTREFKVEAVRLVRDRGVSFAHASRDLGVHENVIRKWMKDFDADPGQAFPGQGHMKPEQAELAPAPNRRWVADFTYIGTLQGWLYVAVVLDLFSRRIVGWSMRAAMTADLVSDALVMALWRRGRPRELLHHSDRGTQYTSEQWQSLMIEHGVTCSLSRSGNVWDNAAMESFFSTLKTERTAGKVYRTRDEARADVFDYIERFYNPKRRHSTIGYISPMQFEQRAKLA